MEIKRSTARSVNDRLVTYVIEGNRHILSDADNVSFIIGFLLHLIPDDK